MNWQLLGFSAQDGDAHCTRRQVQLHGMVMVTLCKAANSLRGKMVQMCFSSAHTSWQLLNFSRQNDDANEAGNNTAKQRKVIQMFFFSANASSYSSHLLAIA